MSQGVNDGDLADVLGKEVQRHEREQLLDVESRAVKLVLGVVEVAHADFTKVARMELVEIGAVMVLTTGLSTTSGMLSMLSDTTVTG